MRQNEPKPTLKLTKANEAIANSSALGLIIGISRDQIDQYVKDGMPKFARATFDVAKCVAWHIQKSSTKAGLQSQELLLKIRNRELDVLEKEGKLVDRESVLKTLADVLVVFKSKLQGIPRKLALQLQGQSAAEIEALLEKAHREALQELSVVCEGKANE